MLKLRENAKSATNDATISWKKEIKEKKLAEWVKPSSVGPLRSVTQIQSLWRNPVDAVEEINSEKNSKVRAVAQK